MLHENDVFGRTDRDYTSGTLLSVTWGNYEAAADEPCRSAWSRTMATRINGLVDASLPQRAFVFAIGQQLYTPTRGTPVVVQPDDRPYAGWLFGRWALHAYDSDRSQTIALDLGMVGPAAGGESSQNFFHTVEGFTRFRGWRNQLRNEFGLQLAAETRRVAWRRAQLSLVGHYGGGLGNIETYLNTGFRLQVGASGLNDFQMPPSLRPASSMARVSASSAPANRAPQGFIGVDLRAIGRNIFLDGNSRAPSHRVSRKPAVAELGAGVSWRWAGADFAYSHSVRSREFHGQKNTQVFGGLSIALTIP